MELLASKNTYTLYLSNFLPSLSSYTLTQTHSIQGNTLITLNLTGISTVGVGVYKIKLESQDNIFTINPGITGNATILQPTFSLNYIANSTFNVLSAVAFYRDGRTTTFLFNLSTVAENILDKDISFLNAQVIYTSGGIIPFFNLESNDNTIYPVALFTAVSSESISTNILLKTDPEINTSLSATNFEILSVSNFINTEDLERISAL
jgi:hypothetical protein